ncbi:MAG TPA: SusC/RagA family TonB-linked outer membrane protein, partial [Chitinophagaceae bacterium]|nr:SusC/RagA family TonB-linked outer membrane protein [Chitinophagaceae bacterium]
TALWGSRAANGVLLITTKRGTVGKPVFSYTYRGTVTKQPDAIPLLNGDQYSSLIPEAFMNRNGTPLNTQLFKEFQYDPTDPYWYHNYSNNTDWLDAITRLGVVHNNTISMTGGGERAKYYTSIDYLDNKGTTVGGDMKRLTMRINLDYNVSDRLVFRTNLTIGHTDNNRLFNDNVRSYAYRKMPNMSIYEYDGLGNLTPNYFSPALNVQGQYPGTANPVALAFAAKRKVVTDRVTPLFKVEYDIIKGVLKSYLDVQFDINNTKDKSFLPQIATGRPMNETVVNRASDADFDAYNVTTNTKFVFTPKFKSADHDLLSYVTFYTYDYSGVSHQVLTANTPSSVLQDPSVPSRTQNSDLGLRSGGSQTRNLASTFSAQYKYKDRYIIQAGARWEAHSRLGPNSRYGIFPNVSARYRLSGEPFMAKYTEKFLDELSIRASYGNTPRAPRSDYSFYNIYSNFGWSYLGQGGVYPSNMELQNLKWEIVSGRNLGFNLSLFKGRITADVDVYTIRTKDLFFNDLQIASFTGYDRVDMNVGTMDNNGWEVALFSTPFKSPKVTVDFNFNIASNVNMIREISPFYPRERGVVNQNGVYKTYMQENNPFGSFYGFKSIGVYKDRDATIARDAKGAPISQPNGDVVYMRFNYPSVDYIFQPGDAMYEDINKDGNINEQDIVYLGNSNPKFVGGFGSSVNYAGFKLSLFFNYRYKIDVINETAMRSTNMYGYDNQSTAVLRRWRKEGDVTDIPRSLIQAGYNWLGSDRYVEDASFVRFRSLTLRYTVPKNIVSRLKVKNLSAYITAENLLTWTGYTGQDPEVSVRGSDPFRVATDNATTPPSKMITLGLTSSF